jgi:hypothetical protein
MNLWWELRQQRQISEAQSTAARAGADASARIRELRATVNQLLLVTRALWEIVSQATGLDDDFLRAKMKEIDGRDGTIDGMVRKPPDAKPCGSCGRPLGHGHERCMWCGAEAPDPDPFPS